MTVSSDSPAIDERWTTSQAPGLAHVVRRLFAYPSTLLRHRDLITTTVRRDIEAQFTGTLLGWFWPLLFPVFMFITYYFIFAKILAFKFPDMEPGMEAAMGIYMFTGIARFADLFHDGRRGEVGLLVSGSFTRTALMDLIFK